MTACKSLLRYCDRGGELTLSHFRVIKTTNKGVWIDVGGYPAKKKFVLNIAVKRYAYENKEDAKVSFLARKRRQLGILRAQADSVEMAIEAMKDNKMGNFLPAYYYD